MDDAPPYTLADFIAEWEITGTFEKIDERPDGPWMPMPKATHWRCELRRPMARDDEATRIRREYDNRRFTADPYTYEDWVRVDDTIMADEDGDAHIAPLTFFFTSTSPPTVYDALAAYFGNARDWENVKAPLGKPDAQLEDWLAQWYPAGEKFTIAEFRAHENGFHAGFLAATRLEIWLGTRPYEILLAIEA